MKAKIEKNITASGIEVSGAMHNDISALMNEMNTEVCTKYAEDSFRYLFWQQQMQASKTTNQKQI